MHHKKETSQIGEIILKIMKKEHLAGEMHQWNQLWYRQRRGEMHLQNQLVLQLGEMLHKLLRAIGVIIVEVIKLGVEEEEIQMNHQILDQKEKIQEHASNAIRKGICQEIVQIKTQAVELNKKVKVVVQVGEAVEMLGETLVVPLQTMAGEIKL